MPFMFEYYLNMIVSLIPFGLGTILIVISSLVQQRNSTVASYGRIVGIIISILSIILVVYNISGMISQFV